LEIGQRPREGGGERHSEKGRQRLREGGTETQRRERWGRDPGRGIETEGKRTEKRGIKSS
jgi:hypothetical protein